MAQTPRVDLVGVGLNATDTLIPLETYPARGSKVEYRTQTVLPGGQVASTVVACQKWGLETRYVGKLGDDQAAKLHREAFAAAGVETQLVTVPGAASPQSLILVDSKGERTVLGCRDDRLILRPEDLKREWVANARALHVDGHDTDAATLAAKWAREAGIPVIADLDEIYPGIEDLLINIDYLIVSRDFPLRLTGESDLSLALGQMQFRYNSKLTAATLGEGGVLACTPDAPGGTNRTMHHAAAYKVQAVDTTGAGDIFHAGFIFGLLRGWPLQRQLDFACAAAALNCTAVGARGGIRTVEQIEDLIRADKRYQVEDAFSIMVSK